MLQRAFQKLDLKQEEPKKVPVKVDLGANNIDDKQTLDSIFKKNVKHLADDELAVFIDALASQSTQEKKHRTTQTQVLMSRR